MTEEIFLNQIVETARWLGWYVYHPHRSYHSEPGFPDLTMVHPEKHRLIFAEIKSEHGKLTEGRLNKRGRWMPGQKEWLDALTDIDWAEVYVWQIGEIELEQIAEVLR